MIFFLNITTSAFILAIELLQDVSCNVTSRYADGQTSYEIKCEKNSDSNKGKIQCCVITQKDFSVSTHWGSRCGAQIGHLNDLIDFNSMLEPTSTTCALSVVLQGKQGKKMIENVLDILDYPPVYLHLIFEISSVTRFFFNFEVSSLKH